MAAHATSLAQEALSLLVVICVPVLAATALVSLLVAVLQAATQVHDITLSHLPRFLTVAAALAISGPWIGAQVTAFAARMFAGG